MVGAPFGPQSDFLRINRYAMIAPREASVREASVNSNGSIGSPLIVVFGTAGSVSGEAGFDCGFADGTATVAFTGDSGGASGCKGIVDERGACFLTDMP